MKKLLFLLLVTLFPLLYINNLYALGNPADAPSPYPNSCADCSGSYGAIYISKVELAGEESTFINRSSTCDAEGDGGTAYAYATPKNDFGGPSGPPAVIYRGETYEISVTSPGSSSSNSGAYWGKAYVYVYIDYDQSGDFNYTDKKVIEFLGPSYPTATKTGTFTVPNDATIGKTLMRIVLKYNYQGGANYNQNYNSTGANLWGESEDYWVEIKDAPPSGPNEWTGLVSTEWDNAGNWTIGIPTGCDDDVIIPNSEDLEGDFYPEIDDEFMAGTVTLDGDAEINFVSGGVLTLCGNIEGSGTAGNDGTGTIILKGAAAQSIDEDIDIFVNTIDADNMNGITNDGSITLTGALNLINGTFTNDGTVFLDSDGMTYSAYLDDFTGDGNYAGDIKVHLSMFSSQSSSNSNTQKGYRQIATPVSGATVSNTLSNFASGLTGVYANDPSLDSGNFPTVWIYDEAHKKSFNNNWYSIGGSLESMQGINLMIKNASIENLQVDFEGIPHTGNLTRNITNSNGVADGKGWNFIGNPYPSPLNWGTVDKGPSDGSAYLFHTEGQYSGTYATVNSQGVGTNGASGTMAIGQGFLIYANTSGDITFTNSNRVASSSTLYYGKPTLLPNELRLNLSNETYSDEVLSYTDFSATLGYDSGLDAFKFPDKGEVNIAFVSNGNSYAINVTDVIDETIVLPISLSVSETGNYSLHLTQNNTIGLTPYLRNNKTGDISLLDSDSPIVLSLEGNKTYTNYEVVFNNSALSTTINEYKGIRIHSSKNEVHIQRSTAEKATVLITNLLGQTILEMDTNEQNIVVPLNVNRTAWVAIVKVIEKESSKTAKVLIK